MKSSVLTTTSDNARFQKRLRRAITLICVVSSLLATLAIYPALAQKARNEKKAFPKGARVVIGSFQAPPGRFAPANWIEWQQRIQETLLEKLSDQGISVLERERLKELKDELKRGGVDVDPDTAQQIGKLSGAAFMVVGRTSYDVNNAIVAQEYVLKLKVRLVSLKTGSVIKNYTAEAKKKGKFANNQGEEEHFLEGCIEKACEDLAKKVVADPPDAEEASESVSSDGSRQNGSLVQEGDGQASVSGGDEAAAKAAARDLAVRNAVMRMARLFTRADSQQATEKLIGEDPSRYAVTEGEPLSESIQSGVCHTTIHVRLFLNSSPESKLALIPRLRERGLLFMPTVMVIVPEVHIQRRLPDPAVETEIVRQVHEAGFNVVDARQVAAIRDQDWARAIEDGNVTPAQLNRLKTDYGADILITGEGVSERAESDRTGSGTVICVARAEIKAFRTDNGEMVFSDAVPQEQATGIAEATVAKNALQNAGKKIAPRIVAALFKDGFGKTTTVVGGGTQQVAATTVNLKLSGWQSGSDVSAFLKALPKVKGVIKIASRNYEASVLTVKLMVNQEEADSLGLDMADDPAIKAFHITVTTSRGTTIEGKVKK